MHYNKKLLLLFVAIIILGVCVIFVLKQKSTTQTRVATELVLFEIDTRGNIISRDIEFVEWAQDFLGGTLTTADALYTAIRILEKENFLNPESYYESDNRKKIISVLDEIVTLLETQKKEVHILDDRITEKEVNSDESIESIENQSIISYLVTLREYIQTETLDIDYSARYDELIYGFKQAQQLYVLIDTAGVSSVGELDEKSLLVADNIIKEITTSLGVSLDTIEFPEIPLVYRSWSEFVDTDFLYAILDTDRLSDRDKERLGMTTSDVVLELDKLTKSIVIESAQKCLYPIPPKSIETTYIQMIGLQRGATQQVYIGIISEPMINGYSVDSVLRTGNELVHPWGEEVIGFQDILINLTDFTCEDVEFTA